MRLIMIKEHRANRLIWPWCWSSVAQEINVASGGPGNTGEVGLATNPAWEMLTLTPPLEILHTRTHKDSRFFFFAHGISRRSVTAVKSCRLLPGWMHQVLTSMSLICNISTKKTARNNSVRQRLQCPLYYFHEFYGLSTHTYLILCSCWIQNVWMSFSTTIFPCISSWIQFRVQKSTKK